MRAVRADQDGEVRSLLVPAAVALALVTGLVLTALGEPQAAESSGRRPDGVIGPLALPVARRMLHGQLGADVIALFAMVGALLLGELLAGLVVALMLSGGELLDERAFRRARSELAALAARAPAVAHCAGERQ